MLRTVAQRIRHAPVLGRQDWLWNLARAPYHRVLGAGGNGVKISVAGGVEIRTPPEFSGHVWETYEPESIRALVDWLRTNPGGLVLDIGCAVGIYSAVCLFADMSTRVIAFDSDLNSLAATRKMCRYASGQRLSVIYGFVTSEAVMPAGMSDALNATKIAIHRKQPTGDVGTTKYLCLTDDEGIIDHIPRYTLDALLATQAAQYPLLVKCDVEGAELLVLGGAKTILAEARPHLLLSVHPGALPDYGHSIAQLREFLQERDYRWEVIAVDHEEHWLARPN